MKYDEMTTGFRHAHFSSWSMPPLLACILEILVRVKVNDALPTGQ